MPAKVRVGSEELRVAPESFWTLNTQRTTLNCPPRLNSASPSSARAPASASRRSDAGAPCATPPIRTAAIANLGCKVNQSEMEGAARRLREATPGLAVLFLLISLFFVHRSFYGMRIEAPESGVAARPAAVKAKAS